MSPSFTCKKDSRDIFVFSTKPARYADPREVWVDLSGVTASSTVRNSTSHGQQQQQHSLKTSLSEKEVTPLRKERNEFNFQLKGNGDVSKPSNIGIGQGQGLLQAKQGTTLFFTPVRRTQDAQGGGELLSAQRLSSPLRNMMKSDSNHAVLRQNNNCFTKDESGTATATGMQSRGLDTRTPPTSDKQEVIATEESESAAAVAFNRE